MFHMSSFGQRSVPPLFGRSENVMRTLVGFLRVPGLPVRVAPEPAALRELAPVLALVLPNRFVSTSMSTSAIPHGACHRAVPQFVH